MIDMHRILFAGLVLALVALPADGAASAAAARKGDVYDKLPKDVPKGFAEFRLATFDGSDSSLGGLRVRWSEDKGLFSDRKVKFGQSLRIAVPPGEQVFLIGARKDPETVPIEVGKVTPVDLVVSTRSSDHQGTTYSVRVIVRAAIDP